jgi:aryl-alcohol dehydrogenase-like predicted oxidoreductase
MEYRQLGTSGLRVSMVGFGCARIGGTIEWSDPRTARRILDCAFNAGITLFDTADLYAQGNSERLLGETFRRRRTDVIIATKGGYTYPSRSSWLLGWAKPLLRPLLGANGNLLHRARRLRAQLVKQDFTAEHLTSAVEDSLRRLRTDYIDLYQVHSPPAAVLARGDFFAALECLKAAGKICHVGVACLHAHDALLVGSHPVVSAVQVPASLLQADALRHIARRLTPSVGVMVRQPFATGLLTRDPGVWTASDFGEDADALEVARRRVASLASLGSVPSLALRYLLQQRGVTSVLIGTTRLDHLEQNLEAIAARPLSAAELTLIDDHMLVA